MACGQTDTSVVTYRGMPLSTPDPIVTAPPAPGELSPDSPVQPPPAWLIIGDEVIIATIGSFNFSADVRGRKVAVVADAVPPQMMPNVATAGLPANVPPSVVVGTTAIQAIQARVQAWSEEPRGVFFDSTRGRLLQSEASQEGEVTSFLLEPVGNANDQILVVSVTFAGDHAGESASYIWRLNPTE